MISLNIELKNRRNRDKGEERNRERIREKIVGVGEEIFNYYPFIISIKKCIALYISYS